MGIWIYQLLLGHVILQIKNHTQLTRTVGNISQSDSDMLADLFGLIDVILSVSYLMDQHFHCNW